MNGAEAEQRDEDREGWGTRETHRRRGEPRASATLGKLLKTIEMDRKEETEAECKS